MGNQVNERFRELMKAKNISINELSKKIGTWQSTLSTQLSSERGISLETIIKTKQLFPDVSAEWLVFGVGNMFVADNLPAITGKESEKELELHAEVARLTAENDELRTRCIKLEGQKEYLEAKCEELRSGIPLSKKRIS
jgi:transcriptional regulator with XRE-family HTH domain